MWRAIISHLSTFSIAIAAILGMLRFRVIERAYHPFIYICWLGLVIEVIAYFSQEASGSLLPSNIYVLLEGLLFVLQFNMWGSFKQRPWAFYVTMLAILILWIVDNLIMHNPHQLSSYYRIGYSFVLVILAIDQINRMIVRETRTFIRNAKFLICIGVIIYFSYKTTTETFYFYALSKESSSDFVISIFAIQQYVNLFVNLLYGYVILWIPKKKTFLEPLR